MAQITCNGELRQFEEGMSVERFIAALGLNPETVVVECDGRILRRAEYDAISLRDGMTLELIRFVGGG